MAATELFANTLTTTVSSGGTTAPSSGTIQTWTVAASSGWPAAVTGRTQFHVADLAAPSELIAVTNVSGSTWTVTRGAESTTPVAHVAGFTVYLVISAGYLTGVQGNRLDWLNVVTGYGADPTGTVDSSTAINNAIAAAAPGQPVYVPTGTYLLAQPIVIQKDGTTLIGDHGATASGDDKLLNAGTVFTISASFTNPTYSAYATAAILILEHTLGASSAQTEGVRLRDFWINGTGSPASVDGITAFGNVGSYQYERIGVYNVTGNAYGTIKDSAGGGFPDGAHFYSCLAQNAGGYGWYGQWTDTEWIDCHAQTCNNDGWYIIGGGDKLVGCRSDLSVTGSGYTMDCAGSSGNMSQTHIIGCSTARNHGNGLNVINSDPVGTAYRNPVYLAGCIFDGDGTNGGAGGGGFAGVSVAGSNTVLGDWEVSCMTIDAASGCPQYGLATAASGSGPGIPLLISMHGGSLNYASGGAAVNDAAPIGSALLIAPAVLSASGYRPSTWTGLPTQVPYVNITAPTAGRTLLNLSGNTGSVAPIVEAVNNTTTASQAIFRATTADTTSQAYALRASGDTNSRWRSLGDGSMKWGPGNATQDTNLYRNAAGQLKTDNDLAVAGALLTANGQPGNQVALYLSPGIAETFSRRSVTSNSLAPGSGTIYLMAVPLIKSQVISNLAFWTGGTAKAGGTHGWYIIADSALKIRAATADQIDASTTWGTQNAAQVLALANVGGSAASTYTVPSSGLYYFGVMVAESAGTMPTFAGSTALATNVAGQSPQLQGPTSSINQTTPPATDGSVTLAFSGSPSNLGLYAYAT